MDRFLLAPSVRMAPGDSKSKVHAAVWMPISGQNPAFMGRLRHTPAREVA
jgi:hypothetical protein